MANDTVLLSARLSAEPAEPQRQQRILVVEDDDNIAAALEFLMIRQGFGHDRAITGPDGLARIHATRPDLVLLDVMLPGLSGYGICEQVRAAPELADVKILMMTARGSALERHRAQVAGADGFIAKPFDLQALGAEVRRLLGV